MQLRSIDKKALMGLTGLVLLGFVIVHLLDNLTIFLGADAINGFAATLKRFGGLLWAVRSVLIAAAVVHVVLAIQLSRENRAARTVGYAVSRFQHTTYAARTMAVSGIALLVYLAYHLLHFTFRVTHPHFAGLHDAQGRHDVYVMVVSSFQDPYLAGGYIVAMVVLCSHLSHGAASFLQSLGLNNEQWLPRLERAGRLLAVALCAGYSSIPVAVLLGVLR